MGPRIYITILLSLMTCSVLFGIGAVAVLSVPALSEQAKFLLPIVIAASFNLASFVLIIIQFTERVALAALHSIAQ